MNKKQFINYIESLNHEKVNNEYIIYDNVMCHGLEFKKIPIKIKQITGITVVTHSDITTFENFQDSLNSDASDFIFKNNKIKSFEFFPSLNETKCHNYDISHNYIKSFKYCPSKINGNFDCSFNKIKSFQYSPNVVGETFNVVGNPLTSYDFLDLKVNYFVTSLPIYNKEVFNKFRVYDYTNRFYNLADYTNAFYTLARNVSNCDTFYLSKIDNDPFHINWYRVHKSKVLNSDKVYVENSIELGVCVAGSDEHNFLKQCKYEHV